MTIDERELYSGLTDERACEAGVSMIAPGEAQPSLGVATAQRNPSL
jgi:hypothetical protein